jgi:hypothetical protein
MNNILKLLFVALLLLATQAFPQDSVNTTLSRDSNNSLPLRLLFVDVTLTEEERVDLNLSGGQPPYFGSATGSVKVSKITDEDGDGIFSFSVTAPSIDNQKHQEWLTVYDASGQEQTAVITITDLKSEDYRLPVLSPQKKTLKEKHSFDFSLQGGQPPYQIDITAGTHSPITDNGDGVYSFTYTAPTVDQELTVTLTVYDDVGEKDSATLTIKPVTSFGVTPETIQLYFGQETPLEVIGGKPPYTWGAKVGKLHPTTGEQVSYTAPNTLGEYTVTVTDSQEETATVQVTVISPLHITPKKATQLLGNDDAIIFEAIGGFEPYDWEASEGQVDPKGAKARYQPPAREGEYQLTLRDSKNTESTASIRVVSIPIITPGSGVLFSTESIVLKVSGGHSPYHWSAEAGQLSNTQGNEITYTAQNAVNGLYTVTVTDSQDNQSKAIIQVVATGQPMCTPPTLIAAVDEIVHVSVAHGVAPYTWPDGTQARFFETRFNKIGPEPIEVRDALGNACVTTVNVIDGTLEITPATAYLHPNDMTSFVVTGGTSPYTWNAEVGSLSNQEGQQVNYIAPDKPGRYHLTVTDGRTAQGSAEIIVTATLSKLSGEPPDTEGGQIQSGIKIDGVARPEQRILIDQDAQVEIKFPLKVPNDGQSYNTYCAVLWTHADEETWLFKTNDPNNPFIPFDLASGAPFPAYSPLNSGESLVIDIYTGTLSEMLGQFNFYIGYAPTGENELNTLTLNPIPYTLEIQ